jgi:hypothetical protein
VLVEFQEGRGVLEVSLLLVAALGLDLAELVQGFLELAGESLVVEAESGEGAVGVDDVEVDSSLIGGRVGGSVEECGFEQGDTVEAPGGVGEFLSEVSFGGSGGFVFIEELAAVVLVCGGVLGCEHGGATGEAMGEGIEGRALFASGGAGSGGEERVGAVGAMARVGDRVCHKGLRCGLTMGGWRFCGWVLDVVGWEGKIDVGVGWTCPQN